MRLGRAHAAVCKKRGVLDEGMHPKAKGVTANLWALSRDEQCRGRGALVEVREGPKRHGQTLMWARAESHAPSLRRGVSTQYSGVAPVQYTAVHATRYSVQGTCRAENPYARRYCTAVQYRIQL